MQTSNRLAYIDWLRIGAILGILLFHSAMPYVPDWWHIKNNEKSNLLMEFNFFISRFRMPLLFFISGAVTHVMLQKRTVGQFILLRVRRLFVPLLFGMLLIVPIQVYMERLTQGFKGNFLNFYPTIFTTGVYPKGNLSWHHLWFIAYLFFYDVIFASFFKKMVTKTRGGLFINFLAKSKRIYFIMIPSIILFSLLAIRFPETNDLVHDFCMIFYWLLFLIAGFLCMNFPPLMDSIERNRRTSFTFALISIFLINYLRWNKLEPDHYFSDYTSHWQTNVYLGLYTLTAWLWVLTAVGYGKKYLNRKLKVLNYINSAVYPFYILHQTIIVILSYYVVQTNDTIFLKYAFTVVLTFCLTMSIYHVFIRPYRFIRFLFGAKKKVNAE